MTPPTDSAQSLLPGTLDVLILKAISLGSEHGYGILLRLQSMSRETLVIEQGALYPALFRLEQQGCIAAEWGVSEKNRRAKFYSLTPSGRKRLTHELQGWRRMVATMELVLEAQKLEPVG